jgi:surfactin synthase thioesterase subunit
MTFKNLGIDSIATVMLMSMLEKDFEVELSVQKFKDYPSIKEFSAYLNSVLKTEKTWSSGIEKNISPEEKWFNKPYPNPKANQLLFLFHDAGGSKDLFESWYDQINNDIEMIVVQLPGRSERRDETPYLDINKLLADLVPLMDNVIDKPYSIYGHSMGGLLGFEVARSLQKDYDKSPAKLLISGTPGLKNYENKFVNYIIENQLTEKDIHSLIPKFQRFDFNDEVVRNMINVLMNDLKLIHSYKYVPDRILSSAIVAIHAVNDVRVQLKDVKKWKTETENQFKLLEVPGSHNFIYSKAEIVTELINKELASVGFESFQDNPVVAN